MLVKNIKKRSASVVTAQGEVRFNEDGIAEVGEDLALRLASLKGYEIVEKLPSADDVNFEAMTLAQLKQFAADNDIGLGGATKKPDIIAILRSDPK